MRSKVGLAILGKRQLHHVMQQNKQINSVWTIYKGSAFYFVLFILSHLKQSGSLIASLHSALQTHSGKCWWW